MAEGCKVKVHFTNPNWGNCWEPLTEAIRECQSALQAGGAIVVHCNAGHHRAPQICSSIFMWLDQISYDEAVTWPSGHCGFAP